MSTSPTGPRLLLRRLREVMAASGGLQQRLDAVVRTIAANMVAEVCSIYMLRGDVLELFATEGLKAEAVHRTTLKVGEGLVGLIAREMRPLALSDAQGHPNFAYRPETGEEIYQSLMGVPVVRAGRVVGVLVVQNRTQRHYTEDEMEAVQTVAMVLAEMGWAELASQIGTPIAVDRQPARLSGTGFAEGLGGGVAVLHEPRIVVERHLADDVPAERARLAQGLDSLRAELDALLRQATAGPGGETREILEAYRMFAHDRGWASRLAAAVDGGLTAEAAVERVQIDNRARMSEATDAYLRERLQDLEDLSNRLLRNLAGRAGSAAHENLPQGTVLVARNMGPAELLEYDRSRLAAVALEEGSATSHVTIVARALGLPLIGRVAGLLDQLEPGDAVLVDAENGQVFLRPGEDVLAAFRQALESRQARRARYLAMRGLEPVTVDGRRISLNINAGLLVDLPNLEETRADGVGLYRTELHFMVRAAMPSIGQQADYYRRVLDAAAGRRVVFRTLDVGGDKVLPYMARQTEEENPAMGWRAIRLSLDRPALFRIQLRALLVAAADRELDVMFPLIAEVAEFRAARRLLDVEMERLRRLGRALPKRVRVGTMLEVPSLGWQLDALLRHVDFLSIGSNDLLQFLFAVDRTNPRVADRYDVLSPPVLSFLREVVRRADRAGVPVALCGEAAGRPLEAMALLGLGIRSISMVPGQVAPVKQMLRQVDINVLEQFILPLCASAEHSVRDRLQHFAESRGIPV